MNRIDDAPVKLPAVLTNVHGIDKGTDKIGCAIAAAVLVHSQADDSQSPSSEKQEVHGLQGCSVLAKK
jgi:hypothetical protein